VTERLTKAYDTVGAQLDAPQAVLDKAFAQLERGLPEDPPFECNVAVGDVEKQEEAQQEEDGARRLKAQDEGLFMLSPRTIKETVVHLFRRKMITVHYVRSSEIRGRACAVAFMA